MTEHTENAGGNGPQSSAAEEVRQAFAGLPLDQRLSTLVKVEIDMLGDVADRIVSAASGIADEIVEAFAGSEPADGGEPDANEPSPAN